ncbi:hypothetical protein TrLO_g5764 [Triparma laevis f. longispina]|nr:hypothetical protein TrLO_g5764 [Triparma laevis f. longispina]
MELQCNKLIETVAEAIPGAVIQTYALLVNDFDSKAAMGQEIKDISSTLLLFVLDGCRKVHYVCNDDEDERVNPLPLPTC